MSMHHATTDVSVAFLLSAVKSQDGTLLDSVRLLSSRSRPRPRRIGLCPKRATASLWAREGPPLGLLWKLDRGASSLCIGNDDERDPVPVGEWRHDFLPVL